MHEISVAQRLIEVIEEELALCNAGARVAAVHLRLGPLSGVVAQALLFAFDAVTPGTKLQGARLEIEEVEPAIYCTRCKAERVLPNIQRFRCPVCQTPAPQVIRGREMEVISLEIADEHAHC